MQSNNPPTKHWLDSLEQKTDQILETRLKAVDDRLAAALPECIPPGDDLTVKENLAAVIALVLEMEPSERNLYGYTEAALVADQASEKDQEQMKAYCAGLDGCPGRLGRQFLEWAETHELNREIWHQGFLDEQREKQPA